MSKTHPIKDLAILVATGTRGAIFNKAVEDTGNKIIRVPYDDDKKKSALAAVESLKAIEQGHSLGIAVDGPKGPYHVIKPGIFFLARKSGKNIHPVSVVASHKLVFPFRWDKYFVPLPFSRVVMLIGDPLNPDCTETELKNALFDNEKKAISML